MPSTTLSRKKKSEIKRLAEKACAETGYNPFDELIALATETEEIQIKGKTLTVHKSSRSERIAIAKEIASYVQPKIKSTETEEKSAPTFNIVVQNFSETSTQPSPKKAVRDDSVKIEKL